MKAAIAPEAAKSRKRRNGAENRASPAGAGGIRACQYVPRRATVSHVGHQWSHVRRVTHPPSESSGQLSQVGVEQHHTRHHLTRHVTLIAYEHFCDPFEARGAVTEDGRENTVDRRGEGLAWKNANDPLGGRRSCGRTACSPDGGVGRSSSDGKTIMKRAGADRASSVGSRSRAGSQARAPVRAPTTITRSSGQPAGLLLPHAGAEGLGDEEGQGPGGRWSCRGPGGSSPFGPTMAPAMRG